jgi:hypothetical protein
MTIPDPFELESAKTEIKKIINPIRIGAGAGILWAAFEFFKSFLEHSLSTTKVTGVIFIFLAAIILLIVPEMLKRESKNALTLVWLSLGFGLTRWIFIDGTFHLNVLTILILVVFAGFIGQFARWVRVGALK